MVNFHILLMNDLDVTLEICQICSKICQNNKTGQWDCYGYETVDP